MRHHFATHQETRANDVPLPSRSFPSRRECLHGARTAVLHGAIRRIRAKTSARFAAAERILPAIRAHGVNHSGAGPAVLPMPGQVHCAFAELRQAIEASADERIAFCQARLAGFKAPETVILETLPKTSTGKIRKLRLPDRAKELE